MSVRVLELMLQFAGSHLSNGVKPLPLLVYLITLGALLIASGNNGMTP